MITVDLHHQSLEYLLFPLKTSPADPATLAHEVAVVAANVEPTSGDWKAATFADDLVQLLVRASIDAPVGGTVTLAPGRWDVYWRAVSNPEYPVRLVGHVKVN